MRVYQFVYWTKNVQLTSSYFGQKMTNIFFDILITIKVNHCNYWNLNSNLLS